MTLRHLLSASAALAIIAVPLSAAAQQGVLVVNGRPLSAFAAPIEAPLYLPKAGASDLFEIESSRVALQKTQNADIRRFAQMMIDHHTRTTQATVAAARAAGLTPPPPALEPHQQAMMAELNRATGAAFDSLYVRQQIMGHQGALGVNRTYSMMGDTPQLRATASTAVPIVAAHLADAERMAMQMAGAPR